MVILQGYHCVGRMIGILQLESLCSDIICLIEFLQENGVLSSYFYCVDCQTWMDIAVDSDAIDGFYMRCIQCHAKQSIRHGSILSNSRLTLKQFLYLVYFWLLKNTSGQLCTIMTLSKTTIVRYTKCVQGGLRVAYCSSGPCDWTDRARLFR